MRRHGWAEILRPQRDSPLTCHEFHWSRIVHIHVYLSEVSSAVAKVARLGATWGARQLLSFASPVATPLGVRIVFWIAPQSDMFFCASVAVKLYHYHAKITIRRTRVTCFRVRSACKLKKTCHRVVRTSFWLISHSEVLWNKKLYRPTIRGVGHLKNVLLHCWIR